MRGSAGGGEREAATILPAAAGERNGRQGKVGLKNAA